MKNERSTRISYIGKKVSIGIDVHSTQYTVTVVVEGVRVDGATMQSEPERLIRYILSRYEGAQIRSAYEAGFSGFTLHRKLILAGINNIVVNAASIAVAARDRVKTDRRDSLKIATQLDGNQLKGIRVPSEAEEARRVLHRTRAQHVKQAGRYRNQIRMRLYQFGYDLGAGFSSKRVRDFLEEVKPLPEVKEAVLSILTMWEYTKVEMDKFKKLLRAQAAADPLEARYRSLPGIGHVASRTLSTELGDMLQFSNERKLFSFVGLTPSEKSSGDSIQRGRITKQGNAQLRKILVQSAWIAVRRDPWMSQEFLRLAGHLGKRRAIVAIARKLIGKARALFRKNEWYCSPVTFAS
jgi:transposase